MTSEAQKRAVAKYDKKNYKKYLFRLNIDTERELIELIEAQVNKQGFIKELLKKELEKMQ